MIELAEGLKSAPATRSCGRKANRYPPEVHDLGVELMLDQIRADLEAIGVHYDNWFSERSVYSDGTYEKAMASAARTWLRRRTGGRRLVRLIGAG